MERQRLENLRYLKKAIQWDEEKLFALRSSLGAGIKVIDGMPVNHSGKNPMEEVIPDILELAEQIESEKILLAREEKEIFLYISSLEDKRISLLLRYRYIDCLNWTAVAWKLGSSESAESVRTAVSRFFAEEK